MFDTLFEVYETLDELPNLWDYLDVIAPSFKHYLNSDGAAEKAKFLLQTLECGLRVAVLHHCVHPFLTNMIAWIKTFQTPKALT